MKFITLFHFLFHVKVYFLSVIAIMFYIIFFCHKTFFEKVIYQNNNVCYPGEKHGKIICHHIHGKRNIARKIEKWYVHSRKWRRRKYTGCFFNSLPLRFWITLSIFVHNKKIRMIFKALKLGHKFIQVRVMRGLSERTVGGA